MRSCAPAAQRAAIPYLLSTLHLAIRISQETDFRKADSKADTLKCLQSRIVYISRLLVLSPNRRPTSGRRTARTTTAWPPARASCCGKDHSTHSMPGDWHSMSGRLATDSRANCLLQCDAVHLPTAHHSSHSTHSSSPLCQVCLPSDLHGLQQGRQRPRDGGAGEQGSQVCCWVCNRGVKSMQLSCHGAPLPDYNLLCVCSSAQAAYPNCGSGFCQEILLLIAPTLLLFLCAGHLRSRLCLQEAIWHLGCFF